MSTKIILVFLIGLMGLTVLTSNCNTVLSGSSDSIYLDYSVKKAGYTFNQPDKRIRLQSDLEETSALAFYNKSTLLTVEDENGYLYMISRTDGKIQRKIKFGKRGDYESVEVVKNMVFAMESNGDISYFSISDSNEINSEKIETAFSSKNDIEGLAFDGEQLLVACKGSGTIDHNKVKGKAVYRFNILTKQVSKKEVIHVTEDELDNFVKSRKYFNNVRDFDPSAIAVQPVTSDIYLLSADKILVIFTSDYEIKEVIKLNPSIYRQPEGICFAPDGTLYISSEGAGSQGSLIELLYKR